jgi:transposase, IS30 family
MSQIDYTVSSRKNKHLTERERYTMETLLKEKFKASEIAVRLGRHRRTIEREIAKGKLRLLNSDLTYREEYCADRAQAVYKSNATNKGASLKIRNDHQLAKHIEERIIKEKYSPDAVIGEIKVKGLVFKTSICMKTLYNYIDKGIFANISNKDLPVKKDKKKGIHRKIKIAHKNLKGTSIEERPEQIDLRVEYGHWEMDCVVGPRSGKGAVLLVLSERCTREEIICKMPRKTQESVKAELDKLEKKYGKRFKEKFKTITVDNGCEFLNFGQIEQSVHDPKKQRVKVYYAHPYSSWERGTNENINKMIRRFIPKGSNIGKISKMKIRKIEQWINNYPRRIFGYQSANEIARQMSA